MPEMRAVGFTEFGDPSVLGIVTVPRPSPGPGAYDHLPPAKQPHLHLRGIDELLSLYRQQDQTR